MPYITGGIEQVDGKTFTRYTNFAYGSEQTYIYQIAQEAVSIINPSDQVLTVKASGSTTTIQPGMEATFVNIVQFSVQSSSYEMFTAESWVTTGDITAQLAETTTALSLKVDKGRTTETFIETISNNPRPVLKTLTDTFTPDALITAVTDLHGIDLIMDTTATTYLGTNKVSLYPLESRSDNKGAGSILLGTAGYFLVRNSGGGAMAAAKALRVNISNSGVGSAITNAMGINIDNPTNSTGGTALNTFNGIYFDPLTAPVNNNYAIYINAVTGGANRNYGIYDLASKNYFTGEIKIDNNNLLLGPMAAVVGTGGKNVLSISKGTAPAAQVADTVQLYGGVLPNAKTTLGIMTQELVVADVGLTSTDSLTVMVNGAKYKIPLVLVP